MFLAECNDFVGIDRLPRLYYDTSRNGLRPIRVWCTDYRNFPRSLVVTAERDVLRDDGRRLGIRMRQAGVDVTYHHYDDEAHGFACSEGPTLGHQHFISLAQEWLKPFSTKP